MADSGEGDDTVALENLAAELGVVRRELQALREAVDQLAERVPPGEPKDAA